MTGYNNPLGKEMEQYLALLEKADRYVKGIKGLFRELDACIPEDVSKEEALSDTILFDWDKTLTCSPITRKRKYSELRSFIGFLQSEGIACHIPEMPRISGSTYAPYIFNETEWVRIIHEADNLASVLVRAGTDMPIVYPMLIRLLYACGLRISDEYVNQKLKKFSNYFSHRKTQHQSC